ncbi:GNAT family N-acetyltransferase [Demequina muriae]|uniref:GNAT family N-acetyltransferase n=1 Tax=Demequina muriae TaxID=3051664 RepID=A0ABT8GJM3_9MICO|nr:GNAT family N-acetyltransferase [Demequina sp. EGI L300058]MDN4481631.1 GNAT family N-acetyltransferase [Demequina sp. EGI L300058]
MTEQHDVNSAETAAVMLRHGRPISSYTVALADGSFVGQADFFDSPTVLGERIFFHTEVDHAVRGRGLAGLLVREALADCVRHDLTVVPVCPLFAKHLARHGDDFVSRGGRFRRPTSGDIALVARITSATTHPH